MTRYSEDSVINAALRAVRDAGKEYLRWTDRNVAPWQAPEYVYTTAIARKIAGLPFKPNVYCELNIKDEMSFANERSYGRKLSEVDDGSRVDILVGTRTSRTSRQVIEVKRRANSFAEIKKDIGRLADVIGSKGDSTIKSGLSIFILYESAPSEKEAAKKLKHLMSVHRNNVPEGGREPWLITGANKVLKSRHSDPEFVTIGRPLGLQDREKTHWAWDACGLVLKSK